MEKVRKRSGVHSVQKVNEIQFWRIPHSRFHLSGPGLDRRVPGAEAGLRVRMRVTGPGQRVNAHFAIGDAPLELFIPKER
ncbi:hypothetical protein MHYP_G00047010 [Metynnis hypsauchen]